MSNSSSSNALVLNRRTFLVALGASTVLVSSCGTSREPTSLDPVAGKVEEIIQSKKTLIADALQLSSANPVLSGPLQVIIDQNLIHIEALSPYSPASASPSVNPEASKALDLPALATRCRVLSTNNLRVASELPDAELSRVIALIAGSEFQHHALLSGYIA